MKSTASLIIDERRDWVNGWHDMKESEHWISDLIKSLSDLLDEPMPEDIREDLIDIIAELKEQDPNQYWGEQGIDY